MICGIGFRTTVKAFYDAAPSSDLQEMLQSAPSRVVTGPCSRKAVGLEPDVLILYAVVVTVGFRSVINHNVK